MATQTTNLNMDIMEPSDTGVVDKMNSNFEKVDAAVGTLNESLKNTNSNLTASDNLKFRFATDGEGNYGYLGADDSLIPFSSFGKASVTTVFEATNTGDAVFTKSGTIGLDIKNGIILVARHRDSGDYGSFSIDSVALTPFATTRGLANHTNGFKCWMRFYKVSNVTKESTYDFVGYSSGGLGIFVIK